MVSNYLQHTKSNKCEQSVTILVIYNKISLSYWYISSTNNSVAEPYRSCFCSSFNQLAHNHNIWTSHTECDAAELYRLWQNHLSQTY